MGLVAATALSLDVPAIGLNARESDSEAGEAGGDAFFGLLAEHLASRGASDKAVAVITAKAASDDATSGAEADDAVAAVLPVQLPVAGMLAPQTGADAEEGVSVLAAAAAEDADAAASEVEAVVPTEGEPKHISLPSDVEVLTAAEATAANLADAEPESVAAGTEGPAAPTLSEQDADVQQVAAAVDAERREPFERLQLAPQNANATDEPGLEPGLDAPPEAPPGDQPETANSVVRSVGNATQAAVEETTTTTPAAALLSELGDDDPIGNARTEPAPGTSVSELSMPSEATGLEPNAVAETDAPQPVNPVEQIADVVVERLDGDGGEARLVLDPPDLGEVVIRLHTRGDQVRLEIVVERPEALQLLRDGSPSLQALLAQRGLDLGDATFSLAYQQSQGDSNQAGEHTDQVESGFAALLGFDEPGDPAAIQKLQRLRSAYNPDGALLYRV